MKANIKIIAAMTLVLIMASCKNKDAHMLTVINEDGTCSREYTFHTNERMLMIPQEEDFDSLIDKTWERSWSVINGHKAEIPLSVQDMPERHPVPLTEAQYDSLQELDLNRHLPDFLMVHVKKDFKTVQDMSDHLYMAERSRLVKAEGFKATSTLEKHFKWFYTDYTFTETFAYVGPAVFPVPLDRFISADSASYWFTGQPDLTRSLSGAEQKKMLDEIEKKISHWVDANWFTEIYMTIAENYDSVENPPLSKEEFVRKCDSLALHPETFQISDDLGDAKGIGKLFDKYFNTDAYNQFLKNHGSLRENAYHQSLSFSTNYDLVMPGRVLDTGMGEYDGHVIRYRISGERTIPNDHKYGISATSRVTNVWAFAVTILIFLLAVGSFFYRRRT